MLGPNGRGLLSTPGLYSGVNADSDAVRPPTGPQFLLCGTLSKALGGCGGIIPSGRRFRGPASRRARTGTTAQAPAGPMAAATARAWSWSWPVRGSAPACTATSACCAMACGGWVLTWKTRPCPSSASSSAPPTTCGGSRANLQQQGILVSPPPRLCRPGAAGGDAAGCLRQPHPGNDRGTVGCLCALKRSRPCSC